MTSQVIYNLLFILSFSLLGLGWNVIYIRRRKKRLLAVLDEKTKRLDKQEEKIKKQGLQLMRQKEKTENLLRNLLPEEAIEELKQKGSVTARNFSNATVLFTDIKGFTKIAASMRPQELVEVLNRYFTVFDEIIDRHNLEKIKTIGDSYMCAGGLPKRNNTHPFETVLAALEIQGYMKFKKEEQKALGNNYLDLRIGIHTGELVAGVIGQKRLAYDIWGDTVNRAHFLEQNCAIEEINISRSTYTVIHPLFETSFKGSFTTKNGRNIDVFNVLRIKPEFSEDQQGITPSKSFFEHMNLILYSNMGFLAFKEHIIQYLNKNLPEGLFYHGVHHTIAVEQAAEEIAINEGIGGEELFLLKTAALIHDAGFTERYRENEEIGARIAKDLLPKFGYNGEQINLVMRMVMATRVPQQPRSHLERILCDADLYYLGTSKFEKIATDLFRELQDRNQVETKDQWDNIQLAFLESHIYHTDYCVKNLRPVKLKNYETVKERLK